MSIAPDPIPLCPEDKAEWLDNYFTTACLVINHALPQGVERLEKTLVELLRKPGWNKMAARLVGNAQKAELCHKITETTFSDPVNFTSVAHAMPISSHPLASTLPAPTTTLSLSPPAKTFRSLFQAENCCISLPDLQKRGDYSPTSAHVTLFDDATLIGLTSSHNIADMATLSLVLKAWLSPEKVKDLLPICPIGDTPLNAIGDEEEDGPVCGATIPRGWELLKLKLWTAWDLVRGGLAEEAKLMYIPGDLVREMRASADQELVKEKGEWVSEHDLVLAFALKLFHPFTSTSTETFTLHRSLDARRWASSLFESSTFLGVAMSFVICKIPASQIATLSPPRLAVLIREPLKTLCAPETEIHRCLRLFRTYRKRMDGSSNLSWTPPATSCTSWCAAKLGDAVEGTRWSGGWLDAPNSPKGIDRYTMAIVCKDASGGYWVATDKPAKQFREIEKAIEAYNARSQVPPTSGRQSAGSMR